jgi:hypothetical protein
MANPVSLRGLGVVDATGPRRGLAQSQASGPHLNNSPAADPCFECVACAAPSQWLYLLGDEGVVYSGLENRFAGLDTAGVAAYRAFDAGVELEDLMQARRAPGTDFNAAGALECIHALTRGIFPRADATEEWPAPVPSNRAQPASAGVECAHIDILDIPVALEFPAGPSAELCRDVFLSCPKSESKSTRPPDCRLSAHRTEESWEIDVDERRFFSLKEEQQLGLGLMHAARSLIYAQAGYDIGFHAAMVAQGERGVLLCAPRECGKSTLAAFLVAQGFELLADEPSLLDLETGTVRVLRLPISLKEGSWPVLREHWPQWTGAPVHLRSDGARICLAHPSLQRWSSAPRRLTQIVFPRYSPSAGARMDRVSPLQALGLLNEGGMQLARHFARSHFESFLSLVCRTPCYRLDYARLEDAQRLLSA